MNSPLTGCFKSLTCIPKLFIPVHGQDDENVAQDVDHDRKDQHAGQRSGQSGRGAQSGAALVPGQTSWAVQLPSLETHLPSGPGNHCGSVAPAFQWVLENKLTKEKKQINKS